MKKICSFLLLCVLAAGCFYAGGVLADRRVLSDQWVRIHVVANSDSEEDQALKLKVRNGILQKLEEVTAQAPETRITQLEQTLPEIRQTAREILRAWGSEDEATVTLEQEAFPQRESQGLRLPAGVYQTLRVTIGKGEGHNWWGVLFPNLCYGAEENVSASLTDSLTGEENIRFFFLEKLGELEKLWKERRERG